jgi:hypothetical protein
VEELGLATVKVVVAISGHPHLHQHHMMGVFFFPFLWIHLALDGMFCN